MKIIFNLLIFKEIKMEKSVERGNVLASACPSRQILQHLTSRWGALVLVSLHSGTKRFSELRRAIDGVSERMLTKTLQELEADGMLIRKSYNTVPPQVDYTLTEFGAQASNKMFELVDWLEMNLGNILASQQNTVSQ
ncbi:transcriptional regulator, HxlR family [Aggregatibacter sp. oral taxon 458 str. W10330]|nr:transcriptional regulator, HxlR family [Aggregatibacter sp. oral taxon 458 str. W10330]